MSKQTFFTTSNKTVTLTADPSDATARLADIKMPQDQVTCSIKANADNTGDVFIRKYGSAGAWVPMAASESVNLVVSNLNQIEAYSENGTEKLNIFVSLA